MSVTTNALRLAALDALAAEDGPLDAPTLILYQNDVPITNLTIMDDLEEATFGGYAAKAGLVFGSAYLDPAGRAVIEAPSAVWESDDGDPSNVVYGWALTNVGKTALYAAEAFPEPIAITAPSQGISALPRIAYGD